MAVDWAGWLRRWEEMQQLHLPHREDRFAALVEAVEVFTGGSPRVLDLGCGPGSLGVRVLDRLPGAEVTGIDTDPVLLAIGRHALASRERLTFVDADLRGDWVSAVAAGGPFDAAVSTTALHWLGIPDLSRLYRALATRLRHGGVLLNGDRFDFPLREARIDAAARARRENDGDGERGVEDWTRWWQEVAADPGLADLVAERTRRHHDHPHGNNSHRFETHREALLAAGFAEVDTIWQRWADRVLIAVR